MAVCCLLCLVDERLYERAVLSLSNRKSSFPVEGGCCNLQPFLYLCPNAISLFLLQIVYSSVHTLKHIKQTHIHTHHPSLSRTWHVSLSPAWCSLLICLCFNKTHKPITTKLPLEATVNLGDFIHILV